MEKYEQIVPFISIIIPTYNRPKQLSACLHSLADLDYSRKRFEIVIVDDGSRETLDDTITPFQDRLNLTLIRKRNGGPASARNQGAQIARGEFLAFTDDDCRLSTDWLTIMETRFETEPDSMFGGYSVNCLTKNIFATTSQLIVDIVYDFYNPTADKATFITSNNMAMSARLYKKINGFDVSFPKAAAEDRDFCDRWIHAGYQIIYAPEAKVYHYHELGLRGYLKQHFNYGRGACHFNRRKKERGSGDMTHAFKFHAQAMKLLKSSMTNFTFVQSTKIYMLLCCWQFANAAGFFYQKLHRLDPSCIKTP